MKLSSILMIFSRIASPKESTLSHAKKSLRGAIICIALSIIPLVVVLMVSDGMIEGITARIIGLNSFHIQINQTRPFSDNQTNMQVLQELVDSVKQIKNVENAYIERDGTVLAIGKTGRSGAAVRACEERLFTESSSFKKYLTLVDGSLDLESGNNAVIGKKIASVLGVDVGDTIRLFSTRTLASGAVVPKVSTFTVTGIVSSGYQEIDALWIFVSLNKGFEYLSSTASTVNVCVETKNPFTNELEEVYSEIRTILPAGFIPYRWKDLNVAQYENFSSTKVMMMFVMFLIVLVACVNVSSALVMLFMEKRKDIAILKSIGASQKGITGVFLLVGGMAGIVGVVIGIPLGLLVAVNVNEILAFAEKIVNLFGKMSYIISSGVEYIPINLLDPSFYLEEIPVMISFSELLIIAIGTVFLSVFVSIIPAIKAGKEKPLNILRKV